MNDRSTTPPVAPVDTGLRCPRCEYNLTGLAQPRCPECGTVFDWDAVGRAAERRPAIAFERARGWRRVPAFFVTGATVLFAPWVFARQAVRHIAPRPALVFGLLCLTSPWLACLRGFDVGYAAGWFSAAVACLPAQAMWLALLDVGGWRRPLRSWVFWFLVGCYTSAVMLTELVAGPPGFSLFELGELLRNLRAGRVEFPMVLLVGGPQSAEWLIRAQFLLWAAALACVYTARLRSGRRSWRLTLLLLPLMLAGEVLLYALVTSAVGIPVGERFAKLK